MKKKLLFLISSLEIGGGQSFLLSVTLSNLSENYNIYIITSQDYKNLYPFKGKYFSLKENIGIFQKILNFLKIYIIIRPIRIYKFIRLISPDVIISMGDALNFFTILTKYIFNLKIPLILSVNTNPKIAYKIQHRHSHYIIKLLYPLKVVDKIVTISKGVQSILGKYYGIKKNKLTTIYGGIDIKKIEELKNEKIWEYKEIFNNNSFIKFVTLGRLSEEKGHKYLIEAFSKVKAKINNTKLIIIGDGSLKSDLEKKIRKKSMEDDILLLGFVDNPYKYIAKSDIFVLPSLNEGFGMVLLEALACKIPIISTDCVGPKEILDNGKYGLLVRVKDSEDLAEKMIHLAKNPDLLKNNSEKLTQRARCFDLGEIKNTWIKLLESYK